MSIVKCKECGGEISTKASACPHCGAKIKPKSSLGKIVIFIFSLGVIGALISEQSKKDSGVEKPKSPQEQQRDRQRGAVAMAAKTLKESMHDPSSFQLEDASLMPDGAGCYTYRAKNGFGALRLSYAVLTPTGSLLPDGNGQASKAWNKFCAEKSGETLTAYVKGSVL